MRPRFLLRRRRGLSLPDMAPVSRVFFLLTIFFLLTSYPRGASRGLAALEDSPLSRGGSCVRLSPAEITISLTANGLVSFASANAPLQRAVVAQVAAKYGAYFTDYQLRKVGTLPFLATKIERLPFDLAAPTATPLHKPAPAKPYCLDEAQLADFARAARTLSPAVTSNPASFLLLIDTKTDAAKVMRLFGLLRAQGVNRINLLTHSL